MDRVFLKQLLQQNCFVKQFINYSSSYILENPMLLKASLLSNLELKFKI